MTKCLTHGIISNFDTNKQENSELKCKITKEHFSFSERKHEGAIGSVSLVEAVIIINFGLPLSDPITPLKHHIDTSNLVLPVLPKTLVVAKGMRSKLMVICGHVACYIGSCLITFILLIYYTFIKKQ